MKRRVVLPRAIMTAETDREPGVTVFTPALMLSIYDPTLDVSALPTFKPKITFRSFVPLPDWLHVDRVHASQGVIGEYSMDEPHDLPHLMGRDFRALLDGRMVAHAFEASSKGGWIRFLATRPDKDGKLAPYSNRVDQDGTDHEERASGPVTGIAFGTVTWLIDPDALQRTDSDVTASVSG